MQFFHRVRSICISDNTLFDFVLLVPGLVPARNSQPLLVK